MGSDNKLKLKPDGMPDMSDEKTDGPMYPPIFWGFLILPRLVGLALSLAVYYMGSTAKYNANMDLIIARDMHWVYLGLVVLGVTINWVNMFPAVLKAKIMPGNAGNLRSNPYVYKVIGETSIQNKIVTDEAGDIGVYNRGNRSLHHMIENFGVVLAGLFLVGSVFPFPTFCLMLLFMVGRIVHQIGYTKGYGSHATGFMLHMITVVVIEGFAMIVGLKGFGVL
mmetsp:Transcript_3616/g.5729  ORF Transcript_3616/g.5729 Transcript_3616/m.5729 type:complete len:223 (-) Transcript_3616:180-848(-)|eukprot:CAMPEP_0184317196 /NCGR_PEP_ID=MMETSP1049-20130417/95174_1 /TAXON_ID=77928 /ORGANISM="Proteomonas sulcata, Strain CCMP704" /LENGTH=222 /DNA_ID=CAMNT_0026636501 /DNA_START=61 /DNA_END=729 /DNA_ORIENTATION=+